jgi:hypothetical protein
MQATKPMRVTQKAHDLILAIKNQTGERRIWQMLERILDTELKRLQNKPD